MPGALGPGSSFRTTASRVQQCAEVVEAVRRDRPGGHELPQALFLLRGEMPCAFDDVREETGAARVDEAVNVLGKRADRGRRRPDSCRAKQPLSILAREQTDRRQAGGNDAAPSSWLALFFGMRWVWEGRPRGPLPLYRWCEASPSHRRAQ